MSRRLRPIATATSRHFLLAVGVRVSEPQSELAPVVQSFTPLRSFAKSCRSVLSELLNACGVVCGGFYPAAIALLGENS